jgi:hypothetical protein
MDTYNLAVQIVAGFFITMGVICLCVALGAACWAAVYAVRLYRFEFRVRQARLQIRRRGG